MVLAKPKSEIATESSVTVETSFWLPGGSSAARPRPGKARARRASIEGGRLTVELRDGRIISVPLRLFPRLQQASEEARRNYELIGGGVLIHWPDVDEDIDVPNLLRA